MFCFTQETIKLLPSCDNIGGTCGFTPLDRDLRSHFHQPPRRDLEVVRDVVGGAAEADEQKVLPAQACPNARRASARGGTAELAGDRQRLQHVGRFHEDRGT
jgi:hypothetical protein